MKKKVVFADLDGTLIDTLTGSLFPKGIWDMKIKFDVLDKIREMSPEVLVIVTNQGGIAIGKVNHENWVKGKIEYLVRAFEEYLGIPVRWVYCPRNSKTDPYRKPNPGMLDHACLKILPTLGIVASKPEMLMIGDASGKPGQFSDSDLKCAENYGIDYIDVNDL